MYSILIQLNPKEIFTCRYHYQEPFLVSSNPYHPFIIKSDAACPHAYRSDRSVRNRYMKLRVTCTMIFPYQHTYVPRHIYL